MIRRRTWLPLFAFLLLAPFCNAQQPEPSAAPVAGAPAASPAPAATPKSPKKLALDQIVAKIPRRVASKDGAPGDMVNFLLIGSEEQMTAALQAAGWIHVDAGTQAGTQKAVLAGIMDTIQKKAFNAMPMSELYLFSRPQDYGWAEGIPLQVVVERNHFRIWKAPWLTSDAKTVWVGAGTHDIGIEKGSDGKVTHKIDPNVDAEREHILQTLEDAGKVEDQKYILPPNPVMQALTATGGSFHSDGRILVIALK